MTENAVLNKTQVADVLKQTDLTGRWWLVVWYELNGQQKWSRRAQFVVQEAGKPRRTWLIHPTTYPSLVSQLSKGVQFSVPHLENYRYDDYEAIEERKLQATKLWHRGSGAVQQLLDGLYRLDDTQGIPLVEAWAWQQEAEALLERLNWSEFLSLLRGTGPGNFEKHSQQLVDATERAKSKLEEIQRFLDKPAPDVIADWKGPVTFGDGSRYPNRITYHYCEEEEASWFRGPLPDLHTYNVAHRRMEREMEEEYFRSQVTRRRPAARVSIREQLLSIRSQIDEVLEQLDDEEDTDLFDDE
ncbi:hypothetical protein ACFPAF_17130 [Hymenobacter endophyticus]|uniref:Uncharacterized protein n=1 Tax=Hymenobacter endophyticus TaxID=3076335 RepID=A0ABU3TL76_9BACT|nr:hypothetical protein [Hymenobacter endophyticus]MDU0372129.1 hypothetical protein [Hymenobacter endophyticus]